MNDGGERDSAPSASSSTPARGPACRRLTGSTRSRTLELDDDHGADAVPEHLLVLGGGYVGLEFGQMFRRFGSRVTIIQRGARLLAREDADVADEVAKILREDGIDVLLQTDRRARVAAQRRWIRSDGRDAQRRADHSPARTSSRRRDASPNTDDAEPGGRGRAHGERRFHPRQRAAGDQRAGHLRAGRRQGRPGLHAHLLRRLPHHSRPTCWRAAHARTADRLCRTPCSSTRSWGASA